MTKKILIIDDSPIARRMLKSCLPQDSGYEVYEAVDGQEGLEKFKDIHPDVIFLDLTMPLMGGIECLEKIMTIDKNTPVIVITADIQIQSMKKVMDLGAFRLLKKPASKKSIQRALMNAQGIAG